MRIGVLTSSRADYGIYLPLLLKLKADPFFELEIIAFGTHLSKYHGFTVTEVEKEGFSVIHKISNLISNDDEQSIATSYAITALKFADFWAQNTFDLVFCLGDRFEMSAAVQAGIPYGMKFAHIHGGETTLGAIDNVYRHQITLASTIHFTATDIFSKKVSEILGNPKNVYSVGSLSLDDLEQFLPIKKTLFFEKFKIPAQEFALVTFHPETIDPYLNKAYAIEMRLALSEIADNLFIVITMPNADTLGSVYRSEIEKLKMAFPNKVLCVENFGKVNYFNAMYYSKVLIGNTSSGIIEAASFGKYVINVGDRQKGRVKSDNIIESRFDYNEIVNSFKSIKYQEYKGENIYLKKKTAELIIKEIKAYYEAI